MAFHISDSRASPMEFFDSIFKEKSRLEWKNVIADDMLDKVLPALTPPLFVVLLFLCCFIHRAGHPLTHKHILPLFHMRLGPVL